MILKMKKSNYKITTHFNNWKNHSQAISIMEYLGIENFWKKGKKTIWT